MAADLSSLSTDDLLALKAGDLSKVSTEGLVSLKGSLPAAERIAADPISVGARNFAQDPGNYGPFQIPPDLANTMAGFYKGARDLGTGVKQLASFGSSSDALRQQVAENRHLDAPLMNTKAGIGGELGFNVASILPTMAIPGVNTVRGAALLGGGLGLAQPSTSGLETAINTGAGAALGGTGQAVANKVVSAATPAIQSVRDTILKKAQDLGFVVSPSEGRGTIVNKLMTGIGNKQQTAQEASLRNTALHEQIAKADLKLPSTEALTPDTFQAVRKTAYDQGYKPVENLNIVRSDQPFEQAVTTLSKGESQGAVTRAGQGQINNLTKELRQGQWTGKGLVDDIRTLREEGNANMGKIKSVADQQLGRAQLKAATLLEDLAERNLQLNKAPAGTIKNFKDARATIAKAHTIEDSMAGTSEVNPLKYAKNEADAKKLSPEMYASWKFAKEFPKSNQPQSKVGGVPWNVLLPSGILGGIGYGAGGAMGHKEGALLGLLPLMRGPARSIALSRLYQSAMVNPESAIRSTISSMALPPAKAIQKINPQAAALLTSELE